MEKRPFFRAATAGLGKYYTGGYGRIGVYRDKLMILERPMIKECIMKRGEYQNMNLSLDVSFYIP